MKNNNPFFLKLSLSLGAFFVSYYASACTISEDMESSIPMNSVQISNEDRLKIVDMVLSARKWPGAEIRGIVYAGGYVLERNPKALATERAALLKDYLIQLGIKEGNIWVDTRIIKEPDISMNGKKELNQISLTLVPICNGGCERLCNDPRVTPTSRAIK
ncbi:hypothetical protein [Burkholderia stagnalis]|uniref:hypothetical protein n=1 Tax=Burkholderia stagnalis TaxID=1503054 RepID=UPI000F80D6BB|nr:hypothetical protein [Burkholderia stagnalis]